ncbi:MAG: 50S ribosomal protein L29 [Planctomycetes bacterium]|nr:50S ribosomal protein L29 [Planctomycetota bacterium]
MNIEATRAMKTDELHNELERLRRHLFDLRAQSVTEKLEDPTQLGKTRKDIARVLTVMHERDERHIEQRQAHLSAQAAGTRKK